MITEYQQRLRDRYLAAPVMSAPDPRQPVLDRRIPIGGLLGIGFVVHPDTGHDLVMVVSHNGHGLFDAVTGEKIARDRDPDPATSTPTRTRTSPALDSVPSQEPRSASPASSAAVCTAPPRTVGPWMSSAPTGPTTASSSPPTVERTTERREAPGGTSSTPTTQNCALPVSPQPVLVARGARHATGPTLPGASASQERLATVSGWSVPRTRSRSKTQIRASPCGPL